MRVRHQVISTEALSPKSYWHLLRFPDATTDEYVASSPGGSSQSVITDLLTTEVPRRL